MLRCDHDYRMNRWHITHGPIGNDPAFIEIEYKCSKCEKLKYEYDIIANLNHYYIISEGRLNAR